MFTFEKLAGTKSMLTFEKLKPIKEAPFSYVALILMGPYTKGLKN